MKEVRYAPILLFVYKRLDTLGKTVSALQQNYLAKDSDLFVFSDASRNMKDEEDILKVRLYLKSITGFKSIQIFESSKNKGLANSIIEGVTFVINNYGNVIVLEDDLITSPNFLSFMNQCLGYYKLDNKVLSIAGFSMPLKKQYVHDVYFTKRCSSWGWATWQDRWNEVDWQISDYSDFRNDNKRIKAFNIMGSDLASMLEKQMSGKIDSWAIRLGYHQFKCDMYTVYPTVSKVKNIGFSAGATHTTDYFNRFDTDLDTSGKQEFTFTDPFFDKKLIENILSKYSLLSRAKYRSLNTLTSIYINFQSNIYSFRKKRVK